MPHIAYHAPSTNIMVIPMRRVRRRRTQWSRIVLVCACISTVLCILLRMAQDDPTATFALHLNETEGLSRSSLDEICPRLLSLQGTLPSQLLNAATGRTQWSSFDYLTTSCNSIRHNYMPVNACLSQEETDFPIAFSVLMYKDVWQFERLLRAIYRPYHFYCVHVDLKTSKLELMAVRKIISCFPNIIEPSKRFAVKWATISQVDAELSCMKDLYQRSSAWKYLINLTGHEFPLKTMSQLVRILKALNGSNSMEARLHEMNTINSDRRNQLLPFSRKYNITAVKGATHVVVVPGYVKYLIENPIAIELYEWLRRAPYPDETFFSTLNHNPHLKVPGGYLGVPETDPFTYPYINRLKNWGTMPCHGYWRHGVCIWGIADLPLLTDASRKELFVNKLFWNYQSLAFDCLEWWFWRKTVRDCTNNAESNPFDVTFYAQLPATKLHQ